MTTDFLIPRNKYLDFLISLKDKQIIKMITGIRRSGKTTLFKIYIDHLYSLGINKNQIIFLNLEHYQFFSLHTFVALHEYIDSRLILDKMNYVFIDEIQMCADFQRALASLFTNRNIDLYVTGSNAYLFSGKLATLLTGRYMTIEMLPLSFTEYFSACKQRDDQMAFRDYMRFGGFPFTVQFEKNEFLIHQYIEGVYNTIINMDIIDQHKIQDVAILKNVIKFLFDNIGNITTPKKIKDTLTSYGHKISQQTIENFLQFLCDSFILYEANRYDVKGKQYLKSLSKYYLSDIGFRDFLLGPRDTDTGYIIENIVFLELIRRKYKVYVGKVDNKEIDFVAINYKKILYIQVAETIRDPLVLERELSPLRATKDFHRRLLITNDYDLNYSYDGIESWNIVDFLLGDSV
jgi:predicted AAA+ superfamily ATPase